MAAAVVVFVSLRYVTFITLYVYVIFDVDLKAMFMLICLWCLSDYVTRGGA